MSALLVLPLWRFAGACAISVAVAALLYPMLAFATRRWPALAARRSAWLLAQAAVVTTFALTLLPPPQFHGGPLITVHADALAEALAPRDDSAAIDAGARGIPAVADRDASDVARRGEVHVARQAVGVAPVAMPIPTPRSKADYARAVALPLLAGAWLIAYMAGVLWRGLRGVRNRLRWRALLAAARRLDTTSLRQHGAFSSTQMAQIRDHALIVLETAAPVSPMLIGAMKPQLVLPMSLREFSAPQQALIVAHELTHWRRRDTLWLAASGALQALFWFNLPLRWLGQRLHWAVELGCDNAVLAGRTQHERHNYAAALVAQLRLQHAAHAGVPAFGALAVRERIERMRDSTVMRLPAAGALMLAAAGGSIVIASVLLQPAFAARSGAAPALSSDESARSSADSARSSTAPPRGISNPAPGNAAPALGSPSPSAAVSAATGVGPAWRYPLDAVRVTSLFGVVSAIVPEGHHGIDFKARRGTPVHAVAAGKVVDAGFDKKYGNYVRIDHGDGRQSLSIHLDSSNVHSGDQVQAGQRIGAAGDTGVATGPHLHLEYWQDGQRRDPALMFPDLDAHASAPALARRAAQQPRAG